MILDRVAFLLLFLPYLGFAFAAVRRRLRSLAATPARRDGLALMVLLPVALVALPGRGGDLLAIAGLVVVVVLLLRLARPPGDTWHWSDVALILVFWLPVELAWLPPIELRLAEGAVLPASLLVVLDLALLVFLVLRPVHGIGYTFRLDARDAAPILAALLAYGAVALPLGLGLGFLGFAVAPGSASDWLLLWLAIYFMNALPEEFLFRGLIQNRLAHHLGRPWLALLITAAIFGLAHVDNPQPGFPVPNWTYALMAALAGLAYGWAWQRTQKVTASAVVHAMVNFVWIGFLEG